MLYDFIGWNDCDGCYSLKLSLNFLLQTIVQHQVDEKLKLKSYLSM